MSTPATIIAAPFSGAGKTTVTLGILRALKRRGLKVGAAKIGPDYIDPAFHSAAVGRPSLNLDSWAMRFETLAGLLDDAGRDCDILIIEGVMGLFDGAPDGTGSSADIAALFDLPVTFVVDGRKMAGSAAALISGYANHREDVEITSLIFNSVASANHKRLLADACDAHFSTPILGYLPRQEAFALPERHLGLVQAREHGNLAEFLDRLADKVEQELDLDRMIRICRTPSIQSLGIKAKPLAPLGQRIAIARDAAFGFSYQATINGWHRNGAEISFFSPLADEAPRKSSDAVYLPGGYPELHAERLSGNSKFLKGLKEAASSGSIILGECGGYMVLGEMLIDREGQAHRMAGILPVVTSFERPKLHLGYRQLEIAQSGPIGRAGQQFRGHEFHYARETSMNGEPLFKVDDARRNDMGSSGCVDGNVCGSFHHLIDRFTQLRVVG